MKFDFEFACDQLNCTNQSLLLHVSSSASCQHILTMCIRSCTYMDTLPLTSLFSKTVEKVKNVDRSFQRFPRNEKKINFFVMITVSEIDWHARALSSAHDIPNKFGRRNVFAAGIQNLKLGPNQDTRL